MGQNVCVINEQDQTVQGVGGVRPDIQDVTKEQLPSPHCRALAFTVTHFYRPAVCSSVLSFCFRPNNETNALFPRAVRTAQSHFLPRWISFKATRTSVSIGSTFDLALCAAGWSQKQPPPLLPSSPPAINMVATKEKS